MLNKHTDLTAETALAAREGVAFLFFVSCVCVCVSSTNPQAFKINLLYINVYVFAYLCVILTAGVCSLAGLASRAMHAKMTAINLASHLPPLLLLLLLLSLSLSRLHTLHAQTHTHRVTQVHKK